MRNIIEISNKGSFADIICNNKKIIKKYKNSLHTNYYYNEINFFLYLQDTNLVTKIINFDIVELSITMEKYDKDVEDLLFELKDENEIYHIVKTINIMLYVLYYKYGVEHNDMKYNNIVYKKVNDVYQFAFIDFSFSHILQKIPMIYGENESFIENENFEFFENIFNDNSYIINIPRYQNWLGSNLTQYISLNKSLGSTKDLRTLYLDLERIVKKKKIDITSYQNLFTFDFLTFTI